MKIEATAKEIRALVQLAELDEQTERLTLEAHRRGRDAAQRRLPRLLRERYDSLLEIGRSPVVVAIERGSCSGCHLRLPTMLECRARHSPAVHFCPHCKRMLYAPEFLTEGSREPASGKKGAPRPATAASAGERS